jgi:[ribosomal protein S5]-alanine N-acetyltransferase
LGKSAINENNQLNLRVKYFSMLDIILNDFPVLTTPRLTLRKVTPNDAGDLLYLRSHKDVMKYLDRPPLMDMEAAAAYIRKMEDDYGQHNGINWMITLTGNDKVIGTIGFWRFDKPNHRAEIGYMLLPEYWGKGLATEAMRGALTYAFEGLHCHSIEANVNPENEASKKLLQKLGFVQEAYFRENYFFDGKFLDSAIFSLLKNKFTP